MLAAHSRCDAVPNYTEGASTAMIQPMQYELERAYHLRCESNAARQRLIAAAENGTADTPQVHSNFGIASRVWRLLVSSRLAATAA